MLGFIEICMRTNVDAGELLARLGDGEALGCWEDEGILHIYWPESEWTPAALEDLKHAMFQLGIEDSAAGLTVKSIPNKDWDATWAASLDPVRLGRRIRVRQSWHSSDPLFDGIELVIDPKRAFGTGHHATTQLVIEWLEDHIRGKERLLDIGTGSGILAMVALQLGAASALAVDADPVALECAREYAELNGFSSELELRIASFDELDSGCFDVIVANLDGRTLQKLSNALPRLLHSHGIACLSGLQEHDCEEIAEAVIRAGLQISARTERGEWLALEVRCIRH